jgi:pimeloyl-ACP methyl ester carboxylesterase
MNLQYKKHQVHYTQFGRGERLLFVFHGFGDQSDLFLNLEEALSERYTVIAIDAPFHGETDWRKNLFKPKDIRRIIRKIQLKLGFERYSLMAHSMGCLIVMGILKKIAKEVDEIIWLAPAGLKPSVVYNKILFNLPLRQFFKWTISKPKVGASLLDYSRKRGWLDRMTHLFFSRQLSEPELRKRMFNTWASLYFFPRRLRQQRSLIRKHQINLLICYGAKDRLTPVEGGQKFLEKLEAKKRKKYPQPKAELQLVNDGHFFIRESLNEVLRSHFKHQNLS